MAQGAEDGGKWSHPSNRSSQEPVKHCHHCKQAIVLVGGRHCAETGCPWCSQCGATLPKTKEK